MSECLYLLSEVLLGDCVLALHDCKLYGQGGIDDRRDRLF